MYASVILLFMYAKYCKGYFFFCQIHNKQINKQKRNGLVTSH